MHWVRTVAWQAEGTDIRTERDPVGRNSGKQVPYNKAANTAMLRASSSLRYIRDTYIAHVTQRGQY